MDIQALTKLFLTASQLADIVDSAAGIPGLRGDLCHWESTLVGEAAKVLVLLAVIGVTVALLSPLGTGLSGSTWAGASLALGSREVIQLLHITAHKNMATV